MNTAAKEIGVDGMVCFEPAGENVQSDSLSFSSTTAQPIGPPEYPEKFKSKLRVPSELRSVAVSASFRGERDSHPEASLYIT
jgi:hypothetical protein